MRAFLRGVLTIGGAGWLALLWAGEESLPPAADVYQIDKPVQVLFQHPRSFSRPLARLPRGTTVRILERRASSSPVKWARVQVDSAGGSKTGWLLVTSGKRRAGDTAKILGGKPGATRLALAIKGVLDAVKEYNEGFAGHFSGADGAYRALRDAWLDPADVDSFMSAGGLRTPQGEGN